MSNRNLEVPYFSQRANKVEWHRRYSSSDPQVIKKPELKGTVVPNTNPVSMAKQSCNVTSLAMLLHYFGVTSDTPDVMMKKVFDPTKEEFASYTAKQKELVEKTYSTDDFFEPVNNLKEFAENFYNVTVETSTNKKLNEVKQEVLAGYPVLVSCGILRVYASSEYYTLSKKEAYSKIFNVAINDNLVTKYDEKITEYNNNISQKVLLLENPELTSEQQKAINDEIETIKNNKKKLEDKQSAIYNDYINDYRYHGHYLVIRGVTDDGVIVNDPWGKPVIDGTGKGSYSVMDGDNIKIPDTLFSQQIFSDMHFYSTLIVRTKRWKFISHLSDYEISKSNFLQICHEAEIFEHGGFPVKRSNLWHNGIHFGGKIGSAVYPIGAGQLIAARIVNKDVQNDPAPKNGSRCFVLVKHQILVDGALKDFFVCYMHLNPINDLENIVNQYPIKKTNCHWLDLIIERSKKRKRVSAASKVVDRDFYELSDTTGANPVGKLPNSSVFVISKVEGDKIYFYYEKNNNVNEYWVKTESIFDANDITTNYKKKIDDLVLGKIVFFTDVKEDDCIEVSPSYKIGEMGEFSGLTCDKKIKSIHLEIFSDSLVINKNNTCFKVFDAKSMPSALNDTKAFCNREEMIKYFEDKKLYGNIIDSFRNLKTDGVISKSEMLTFYNTYEKSKIFEEYIIQHISEWSDKIDWIESMEQAKGVPNDYFLSFLPKNENYVGTLQEYISAVYIPYRWLSSDCIAAMKTNSNNLEKGLAYFYHPSRFIKWLWDNNL